MKRVFLFVSALFLGGFYAEAQSMSDNAIGLRFGAGNGIGTEISYQKAMGGNNRLEIDLGWNGNDDYNRFAASGIYQWVWSIEGNWNWYAGVGGTLGSWNYDNDFGGSNEGGFNLAASGQIGIEYNFDIPLLISLDLRPSFWIIDDAGFDWNGVALGVRYQF